MFHVKRIQLTIDNGQLTIIPRLEPPCFFRIPVCPPQVSTGVIHWAACPAGEVGPCGFSLQSTSPPPANPSSAYHCILLYIHYIIGISCGPPLAGRTVFPPTLRSVRGGRFLFPVKLSIVHCQLSIEFVSRETLAASFPVKNGQTACKALHGLL